ncbi:MAG: MarR family winged helix-turn-helix transcriptional regulator, partial [Nitrospiria bacterium]
MGFRHCACFNLRKTTRAVTQYYDRMMKSTGLRGTQFTILATLAEAGTVPMTQLAKFLIMDRTTLTRNLRPLEKQGYLNIARGGDLRVRNIRLTDKGRKALEKAKPLWENAQENILNKLGESP